MMIKNISGDICYWSLSDGFEDMYLSSDVLLTVNALSAYLLSHHITYVDNLHYSISHCMRAFDWFLFLNVQLPSSFNPTVIL